MAEDTKDFAELLDEIRFGEDEIEDGESSPDKSEEKTNPEGPSDTAESDEDKPDVESDPEEASEPASEAEAESETAEAGKTEEDKSDKPDEIEPAKFEIDGETYTLDEIREWKNSGLRQSDYTRKAQSLAEERKQSEERIESRDALLADVLADESMKEFIRARPEVLPILLSDPDNTRQVLGKPDEVQALWDDYELVADNPRLAARFAKEEPDAELALQHQRVADNVAAVANALDNAVDELAAKYEGVDPDDVKDYVLKLGRVPMHEGADPQEVVTAFGRLYNLFFVEDGDGLKLDPTIIQTQYENLSRVATSALSEERAKQDEHNAEVDAQLKDTPPPAVPHGSGPGPAKDKEREYTDVNEVIRDLQGY
jgi:hypothetical protein